MNVNYCIIALQNTVIFTAVKHFSYEELFFFLSVFSEPRLQRHQSRKAVLTHNLDFEQN